MYRAAAADDNSARFIWSPNSKERTGYYYALASSNVVYKITFAKAIQTGDVISCIIKGNSNSASDLGICLQADEVTARPGTLSTVQVAGTAVTTTSQEASYTVQEGDAVIGATALYIYRKTGGGTYFDDLVITRPDNSRITSDLTAVKENITLTTADGSNTYTLVSGTDFTTSSTGALTYASADEAVATVDASGVITAVANGSTTITVSQAEDDSYLAGSITIHVVVATALDADVVMPEEALDLTDADKVASQLDVTWSPVTDGPVTGADDNNNYVVFSAYAAYQTANAGNIKWMAMPKNGEKAGGSSTNATWDAPEGSVFVGSSSYGVNDNDQAKVATFNSGRVYTKYSLRVKGASKAQFLINSSKSTRHIFISSYEITDGVAAQAPTESIENNTNALNVETLTLDKSKEYLLTVIRSDTDTNSNSNFYEFAFFYDKSGTVGIETINPAPASADGAWYNLAGQRVAQPTKGLFIKDGKKYIIK